MDDTAALERYVNHNLKIKHLRMLVALADMQTIARVAQALHLSQPAVSKMLAEMEAGLGIALFEKAGRGIKPTAYGSALIRYARDVLFNMAKAKEELRLLSTGVNGRIRVGVLVGLATQVLLSAVRSMKLSWPQVTIAIREGTHSQNIQDLQSGLIDLLVGRVYMSPELGHFEVEVLYEEPLVLVASKTHTLTQRTKLQWKDLEHVAWIMPMEDSPTHQRLLALLAQHNVRKPKNVIECVTRNLTMPLLTNGEGVGMLPLSDARLYVDQGLLEILPISLGALPAPMGMIWNKGAHISQEMALFQEKIRQANDHFVHELNLVSYQY